MSISSNGLAMVTLSLPKREVSGSSLRWTPIGGFRSPVAMEMLRRGDFRFESPLDLI